MEELKIMLQVTITYRNRNSEIDRLFTVLALSEEEALESFDAKFTHGVSWRKRKELRSIRSTRI